MDKNRQELHQFAVPAIIFDCFLAQIEIFSYFCNEKSIKLNNYEEAFFFIPSCLTATDGKCI